MKRKYKDRGPSSGRRGRSAPPYVGLLVVTSALFFAGCGGDEAGAGDDLDDEVVSFETEASLRAPVYDAATSDVLALTEGGNRLVKLDVEEPAGGVFGPDAQDPRLLTIAEDLEGEGAGENVALDSRREGRAFVPQPGLDHVQVLQTDDLLDVRSFDAGEPASRAAMSGPNDAVYALSTDGKTVTAVDLGNFNVVAEKRVDGGEETLIETSPKGDDEFWLAGPEGVSLHSFGTDARPEGEVPLDATALAVDAENAERAYASEAGTGHIVAVEPEGDGLGTVAETDLGEEVLYLTAEPGRLYAVTPGSLVALDPESLETIRTVQLFPSGGTTGSAGGPKPSGIAVGKEGVYVTLEGETRVLLAAKPSTEE